MGYHSFAIATVLFISSAMGSEVVVIDPMESLIAAYTEVLLIGTACQMYGASAHGFMVDRTKNDFIVLGLSKFEAQEFIEGLIDTEGPAMTRIIAEEATKNHDAVMLYCSTAYTASVAKLDTARIDVINDLNK